MRTLVQLSDARIYWGSLGGVVFGVVGGFCLGGVLGAVVLSVPFAMFGGTTGAMVGAPRAAAQGAVIGLVPPLVLASVAMAMGCLSDQWSIESALAIAMCLFMMAWSGGGLGALISLARSPEDRRGR